jgi:Tol biopolymer transport system component
VRLPALLGAALATALAGCARPDGVAGEAGDGLVFVARVEGSSELVRARLSDGALRALTHTPDREESWPCWSREAAHLVFEVSRELVGGESDLVLWDAERGERPLLRTPRRDERWAVWSPDGARIAYAFRGGEPASGVALHAPLAGASALLAGAGRLDYFLRPSFAPDGRRLVAQRRGPDGRGSRLWLLADGEPPRPLLADRDAAGWFDWKAWFTRDGEAIVFSRRPPASGPGDVAVVGSDGSHPRAIASLPESDEHSARPSPTRDEIAFVSDRGGTAGVYLAPLSGAPARVLVDSPERDEVAPRWSPDGERIVLTFSRAGAPEPRLVDAESLAGAGILVVDRGGRVLFETAGFMPDWMPPWP